MRKLLLFSTLFSFVISGYAKIGETGTNLKNRLTVRSGGCVMYTSKDEQYRELLELPYKDLFLIMPRDIDHMFFFKRADGKQASTGDTTDQFDLDGWEVHSTLLKNVSVMECYKRHPFMNPEELARLMQSLVKDRENVTWIATSDFVKTSSDTTEEEETYTNTEDQLMAHLSSILPKVKNKRIEIGVSKEVASWAGYNDSLVKRMYTEAREKAFARKKSEIEADRERVAQATSRKTSQQRQTSKESNSSKISAISVTGASSLNSINLKTERDAEGTEIKFYTSIPTQEDTAFGFNYISTDGALRAKIILGTGNVPLGLLVMDTRFDKLMRTTMDKLYEEQSDLRDEAAIKSVGSF